MLPEGGGGDTLFADMEVAYASLEQDVGFRLCGQSARHGSEHVYRGRYADRGAVDEGATYPTAVHPVVRTHPETSQRSLFVNPSFTVGIEGPDGGDPPPSPLRLSLGRLA